MHDPDERGPHGVEVGAVPTPPRPVPEGAPASVAAGPSAAWDTPEWASRPERRAPSRPATVIACLAGVAALTLARDLLVPFALAGLFSFLLAPVADGFERLRLGRGGSALLAVALLACALVGVGWAVGSQAVDLARRLPEYRANIERKIESLRASAFGLPLFEAKESLDAASADRGPGPGAGAGSASRSAAAPATPEPVPVQIVPARPSTIRSFSSLVQPLLAPLALALVVAVLSTFLLAYRGDVRDLLIRLLSRGHIGLTTQAFDEASRRVGRYLAAALLVNTVYGVAIGVGLGLVGVPSAALWGVLAGLLRFIPYVGTWIGGGLPLAVAFAVYDGWGRAGAVFLLVVLVDLAIGNVLEPILYGKRTGLSPLAVVVAIVFWTWVWGIPGLLLAVPMTLCVAVAGRYVPGLEFLDVLLRDRPALGPGDRAYQRLVALDPDGARRVAEEGLAHASVEDVEESVLIGALRRAETDRLRGALDAERLRCVCEGATEAAEDLEVTVARREGRAEGVPPAAPAGASAVLCIPAGGVTDAAACEVLARRLAAGGLRAGVGTANATSGEVAERVARERPLVACVAAVPPFASTRVRYLIRRIRSRSPEVSIVATVWDPSADRARLEATLSDAGADRTALTLAECASGIRTLAAERRARADRPVEQRAAAGSR